MQHKTLSDRKMVEMF